MWSKIICSDQISVLALNLVAGQILLGALAQLASGKVKAHGAMAEDRSRERIGSPAVRATK